MRVGRKDDAVKSRCNDVVGHVPGRWFDMPAEPLGAPVHCEVGPEGWPSFGVKARCEVSYFETVQEVRADRAGRQPRVVLFVLG